MFVAFVFSFANITTLGLASPVYCCCEFALPAFVLVRLVSLWPRLWPRLRSGFVPTPISNPCFASYSSPLIFLCILILIVRLVARGRTTL